MRESLPTSSGTPLQAAERANSRLTPDTYYFRYYTTGSKAHEVERVVLPNSYASFIQTYPDDPGDPRIRDEGDT